MTCPSCAEAAVNPSSGMFHAGCKECQVRQLAHGVEYAKAQMTGKLGGAYLLALRGVFGDDWQAGHFRVKAAAKRMQG